MLIPKKYPQLSLSLRSKGRKESVTPKEAGGINQDRYGHGSPKLTGGSVVPDKPLRNKKLATNLFKMVVSWTSRVVCRCCFVWLLYFLCISLG